MLGATKATQGLVTFDSMVAFLAMKEACMLPASVLCKTRSVRAGAEVLSLTRQ